MGADLRRGASRRPGHLPERGEGRPLPSGEGGGAAALRARACDTAPPAGPRGDLWLLPHRPRRLCLRKRPFPVTPSPTSSGSTGSTRASTTGRGPSCCSAGREAARALGAGPGDLVLDVGCGTGFNLPLLAGAGASVVGIECAPAMRARAEARLRRTPEGGQGTSPPRPPALWLARRLRGAGSRHPVLLFAEHDPALRGSARAGAGRPRTRRAGGGGGLPRRRCRRWRARCAPPTSSWGRIGCRRSSGSFPPTASRSGRPGSGATSCSSAEAERDAAARGRRRGSSSIFTGSSQ